MVGFWRRLSNIGKKPDLEKSKDSPERSQQKDQEVPNLEEPLTLVTPPGVRQVNLVLELGFHIDSEKPLSGKDLERLLLMYFLEYRGFMVERPIFILAFVLTCQKNRALYLGKRFVSRREKTLVTFFTDTNHSFNNMTNSCSVKVNHPENEISLSISSSASPSFFEGEILPNAIEDSYLILLKDLIRSHFQTCNENTKICLHTLKKSP